MRKYLLLTAMFSLTGAAFADENPLIGVVNFSNCIIESKAGKKEQDNIDNLRHQMTSLMENSEKELREISAKFEDDEYLDSLSPKAEEELKLQHQALQEDLNRYQQQFYQVLHQANYQLMQKINMQIAAAAEKIAKEKGLDYVINREACFFVRPNLDITDSVIQEMDRSFESNENQISNISGEALPFNTSLEQAD